MTSLPVLTYLQRRVAGELLTGDATLLHYPTPISQLLGIEIVAVDERAATVRMAVTTGVHGNQQGTVHGGTIAELADAAIGTAHSTVIREGESFATIELSVRFLRPVWHTTLAAGAWCEHAGRTVSHYRCEIRDDENRLVAIAESAVMTVRGEAADRSGPTRHRTDTTQRGDDWCTRSDSGMTLLRPSATTRCCGSPP
ncbi:PaaI family thioesterase [Microbacterium sp. ET2]|uniref:PaaI family thioesterase n=1 Tax=Microbacterium albipurpureum TaxID=3050384 RepID=UPI00259CDE4F|nr:PaaI family thioesterase [Microbacterium sp. ET2 (Ac-2212)]WJL94929.1 PaaI family thioesterase [Microbacterium sp. ET2 (Ac-2212)]